MDYIDSKISYHGTCVGDYPVILEFHLNPLTPTIAQFDAAATAFFNELEAQKPGHVDYVYRTIEAQGDTSGNFWEPS